MLKLFYLVAISFCISNPVIAKEPTNVSKNPKLLCPDLVGKFYNLNQQKLFWFNAAPSSLQMLTRFSLLLDSAYQLGLNKEKYHYSEVNARSNPIDTAALRRLDMICTDALIAYAKDVYQGVDIMKWIKNDEVSAKSKVADNDFLLNKIAGIKTASDLVTAISSLEPNENEYLLLKNELIKNKAEQKIQKTNELISCLNLYRWIHHFHFDKYIVVNIPAATLRYFEKDSLKLESKVVVGKIATKSPRFSTWCYQVILYPYWNVPRDIGLKELLPHFKRSPAAMDRMNMQLTTSNGKVIDHRGINWSQYNRSNFPYTFRQCTGCDNSLGVIKFNLSDPFDVYLHDTNFKVAFLKDTRFLSHGCIRVEKPIQLGNYLLGDKLDSNFLKACYKDQLPKVINLDKKVPVFVVYMPAEPRADSVYYYKDIYRLFK